MHPPQQKPTSSTKCHLAIYITKPFLVLFFLYSLSLAPIVTKLLNSLAKTMSQNHPNRFLLFRQHNKWQKYSRPEYCWPLCQAACRIQSCTGSLHILYREDIITQSKRFCDSKQIMIVN